MTQSLRIAIVSPELHRHGGTERANAELVARLGRCSQLCLFAHHWEPDGTAGICFHRVPVIPWPGLLRFLSFFLAATWQVRRAERQHGAYDAIYSPGPNCRQVQVSSAWFCQARQLELFRSGKHRPPPAHWRDWLKLAHRWSYAAVVSAVEKYFYSRPTLRRVVAQSRLLAGDLRGFYGLAEERIVVAHGGVNAQHFDPAKRQALRDGARRELGIPDGEFVFLFVGNNWLIKGLYHVMQALAAVPQGMLFVVGVEYEPPESWQKLSRSLGVEPRVRYLRRRPDILYYYAAADALVAPSVYDTFPLMPMEAMACGLPVIISRQTGTAEIVSGEECLVISQLDDASELSNAMRRLSEDAELCARLVQRGLALARRRPWDGIYQAISAELLSVAQTRAAQSAHTQ